MTSQDFDETDKMIEENIKSVGTVDNDDPANNNDRLYRDDT